MRLSRTTTSLLHHRLNLMASQLPFNNRPNKLPTMVTARRAGSNRNSRTQPLLLKHSKEAIPFTMRHLHRPLPRRLLARTFLCPKEVHRVQHTVEVRVGIQHLRFTNGPLPALS